MLLHDLRYGLRQMSRNLGFTVVAVLTSALGIALTASMFTVMYAVLLRPLPFPHAKQIVLIGQTNNLDNRLGSASLPNINDWRAQTGSFQEIAYWELTVHNVESNSSAKSVVAVRSSANLFSLLQVQPMLGHTFSRDEDHPGKNNVAVLSAAVWKSVFSSDPKVINSSVKLGGDHYTVVGVMPESFIFPLTEDGPTIWVPIQPKKQWEDRNTAMLQAVGRLKEGVPVETAQAELTTISARTDSTDNKDRVLVKDYREAVTGDVRTVLFSLEAAVLAIWLIACVNVVGLLLARATSRRREIAIRCAIGSNRWQLLRQFFAESALLSGLAGMLGLWLSFGATHILRAYLGASLPFVHTIGINLPVIGVILLLSMISTLLFGMWPALQAYRTEPQEALSDASTRAGTSRRQRRVRDILVVCEVALSLVLLLHAGLLLRTIYNLRNIPLGFVPQNLIVAQLPLLQENYAGRDVIQTVYKPLLEGLQQTPGVQSAAISSILPMSPDSKAQIPVEVFGRSDPSEQGSMAELRIVSPDIYRALGIRLLSGRSFTDRDSRSSPWVVVVNQTFARKYFQNEDPIGKQIRTAGDGPHKYSAIVGVVEDTHQKSLAEPAEPEVDLCYAQLKPEDDFTGMLGFFVQVAVRTDQQPATVIPGVRKLLQQINPEGAYSISTMQEAVDKSLGSQTLVAQMVWLFAGSALLIAVIGLYGLLAYNVSMSTRDIAVRLALGATRSKVLSMVLKHALLVLGAGLVIGFIVWQQTANLLRNYLYGVGTHDFPTILAVAGVLMACGLLAGYIPARRASLVDPMRFLRHE
jgi:putative ABC transport system permease protein